MNEYDIIYDEDGKVSMPKASGPEQKAAKSALVLSIVSCSLVALGIIIYCISFLASLISLIPVIGLVMLAIEPIKDFLTISLCLGISVAAAVVGVIGLIRSLKCKKKAAELTDESAAEDVNKKATVATVLSIVGMSLGVIGFVGYILLIGVEIFLYVMDTILSAFIL